ncbi:MAG: cupredoxin domain-containing protein [Actinomycetota bacterium]
MTGPRTCSLPITVLATAALIAMLAAPTSARPAAFAVPTRDTKIVKGMAISWSPTMIRISRNDTIKWKTVVGSHTVTAHGANWHFNHSLNVGSPVVRRFSQRGTFKFRCTFHSSLVGTSCTGMCGKIVVSA